MTLTPERLARFHEDGFVIAGRLLDKNSVARLRAEIHGIVAQLPAGNRPENIRDPHERSGYFLDICLSRPLVECIEQVLGPDLLMWGSYGFAKPPDEGLPVDWHQDAYYFPLTPMETVTAWLAVDDTDLGNGCLQMIPGSHRARTAHPHRFTDRWGRDTALPLSVEVPADSAPAACLEMKAGEFSIHDPYIIHGSAPNRSSRPRCGIQILYMTRRVHLDTSHQQSMGLDWRTLKLFHCMPDGNGPAFHYADRPDETLRL